MSRNNTGNPIGSKAFPDFEDNVKNLDEAVNTADPQWVDRFGRSRLPLMEQERQFVSDQERRDGEFQADQSSREAVFSDFLQASGYQDLGEYAPGIEITTHNQYVTFGGQPYLLKPSIPVPYTTSGEWTGDDFKLIGDGTIRQDLANPDIGAAMVARGVVCVDGLKGLAAIPPGIRRADSRYKNDGFYAGSAVGGGDWKWKADEPKSNHNGGTVIDPDRINDWDGTQGDLDTLFQVGIAGGSGCFVRMYEGRLHSDWFGIISGDVDNTVALEQMIFQRQPCRIATGVFKYTGNIQVQGYINLVSESATLYDESTSQFSIRVLNEEPKHTTQLSASFSPTDEYITVSDSTGIEVGDVVRVKSDKVFNEDVAYYGFMFKVVSKSGNNIYMHRKFPIPLDISTEIVEVTSYTPSTCNIDGVSFVRDATVSTDAFCLYVHRGVDVSVKNSSARGYWHHYHFRECVNIEVDSVYTGYSPMPHGSGGYGVALFSCTDFTGKNVRTKTGRHGFASGGNTVITFGIALENSRIFTETGDFGIDTHRAVWDIAVKNTDCDGWSLSASSILENVNSYGMLHVIQPRVDGVGIEYSFKNVKFMRDDAELRVSRYGDNTKETAISKISLDNVTGGYMYIRSRNYGASFPTEIGELHVTNSIGFPRISLITDNIAKVVISNSESQKSNPLFLTYNDAFSDVVFGEVLIDNCIINRRFGSISTPTSTGKITISNSKVGDGDALERMSLRASEVVLINSDLSSEEGSLYITDKLFILNSKHDERSDSNITTKIEYN